MGMVMTKVWLAALLAVGAFYVIGTAGAAASCVMPRPLPEAVASAPLVFVGPVVSTSDGDRVAHVKVESIWKGPGLPAHVDVHGSPVSGFGTASSVDRRYRAGERDLFVLLSDQPPYQDNSCSATQPYTAQVAALAPADAKAPAPPTAVEQIQNFAGQYWLPIAIALVVIAVAAFAGMRRLRSVTSTRP
ncbi:MAG: hypothetical protein PVS2B1_03440 [Candidatus Dormibacteraceae bacterium]